MKSGSKLQKITSPVLMWGIIFTGAGSLYGFSAIIGAEKSRFLFEMIFSNEISGFLLLPAFVYWIYFFIGAVTVHREAANSVASVTKIITAGVYWKVRHPIYSADMILSWGIFLYHPDLFTMICVLWADVILFFWMRLEEKLLIERFGKEYEDYMKKTPMFFPGLK